MPCANTRATGVVSNFKSKKAAPNDDKIQQYAIRCNNPCNSGYVFGGI